MGNAQRTRNRMSVAVRCHASCRCDGGRAAAAFFKSLLLVVIVVIVVIVYRCDSTDCRPASPGRN